MKAVIMAGGRGTRIESMRADVPKPMIEIAGKPILEYQVDCLKKQGITDITIVIGYLGSTIKNYFGNNVKYIEETIPLGTAGGLFYLKETIEEDFLLINGDVIFDVDLNRMVAVHKIYGALATIFTHPNDHPYDSGLIYCEKSGKVIGWYAKEDIRPTWYKNMTNAGIHVLSPKIFERFISPVKTDLDREILRPLIAEGGLYAYRSPEYVRDAGTPERFRQTEADIEGGVVSRKSLLHKQKAVFIDRDGTINKYVGFLSDIDKFELIEGVADTIRMINKAGFLAICVTNQPVIARGELTFDGLTQIHNKMETLLGHRGAYLDDIFFCPHHPDGGYEGEVPELKINCNCRKPHIGMFTDAAEKYNIDLSRSIMVGDSETDRVAGENANCKYCFLSLQDLSEFLKKETIHEADKDTVSLVHEHYAL
jgi:D-glycero-D-manno-heptose 1,7-bisphosphate phosphatase